MWKKVSTHFQKCECHKTCGWKSLPSPLGFTQEFVSLKWTPAAASSPCSPGAGQERLCQAPTRAASRDPFGGPGAPPASSTRFSWSGAGSPL